MRHHLHLVSDSTGGTLASLLKACLAQFDGVQAEEYFWPLVRSAAQLAHVVEGVRKNPGPVLYTLVDEDLVRALDGECRALAVPALSVLHPPLPLLARTFRLPLRGEAGLQHRLDAAYFARMEAVDYALHHDDGQRQSADLARAAVVLVGVSRTSKTPTCIYLAQRGIRAANVPLVPGVPFPDLPAGPLYVALTIAPDRLVDIRRNRLAQMGNVRAGDYLDAEKVHDEIRAAQKFYTSKGWPDIDVTRRSVEETAAEVIRLLEAARAV